MSTRATFLNLLNAIETSQMLENGLHHGLVIKLGFEGGNLIENLMQHLSQIWGSSRWYISQ